MSELKLRPTKKQRALLRIRILGDVDGVAGGLVVGVGAGLFEGDGGIWGAEAGGEVAVFGGGGGPEGESAAGVEGGVGGGEAGDGVEMGVGGVGEGGGGVVDVEEDGVDFWEWRWSIRWRCARGGCGF